MPLRLRLLSCLLLVTLGGCSSWQPPSWLPSLSPWQQDESTPAPVPDPAIAAREQAVTDLIARGDLALTKDRLSVPASDNALLYYRQALELDPGNPRAQAGIRQVAKRFRKLARVAHGNGNIRQAEKYLREAEAISGRDNPANRKLRRELQHTPAGQDPRELGQPLREKLESEQKRLQADKP